MRITIFGANGPTGRLLTEQALAAGHGVVATTRNPDRFPLSHQALTVASVDVYDKGAVADAVAGADAVLSTLGVPFTRRPITTYSAGTGNIVSAMSRHGAKRLAVVSSSAVEPTMHADGGFMLNRVMQPLITRTIGKTTYADMRTMEALLRECDLDWTVLRPGGLFDSATTSDYELTENRSERVHTSRADLAAGLLAQAGHTDWVRKVVAINTVENTPTLWQLIRRETLTYG